MIHSILEWRKASAGEQTTGADDTETRVESLYLRDGEEKSGAVSAEEEEEEKSGAVSAEEEEKSGAVSAEAEEEEKSGAVSAEEEEEEKYGAVSAEEEEEKSGAASAEEEEEDGVAAGQTQTNTQQPPLLGLILTPTRELAVQVQHHIDAVARFTGQCVLTNTYRSQCWCLDMNIMTSPLDPLK